MGVDAEGYYSYRDILGYGGIINIILSDRGRGKTHGFKTMVMKQSGTFMCLYRQEPDMQLAMKDWLESLIKDDGYDRDDFSWEGSDKQGWTLYYQGAAKGFFRYLTQVNHIKQEVFPDDLNWLVWDEFIPLVYKKLAGVVSEGDALRTIMKTIDHDSIKTREEKGLKPLRVILIANPFTWNNPILSYFHVVPREGIHRIGPGIVCEYLPPIEEAAKPKNLQEKMDIFLGNEVIKNQGWMDQQSYIKTPPKGAEPWISLRLEDRYFWILSSQDGKRFIVSAKAHHRSEDVDRYGTMEGLRESERCLEDSNKLKMLQSWAYGGMVWYEDLNTKFDFLNRIVR